MNSNQSQVIFVSGFADGKPNESEIKENCWRLSSSIFGYREWQRSIHMNNLLCVVNESQSLDTVSPKNVEELLEMIYAMPLEGISITRVIIAHSHGSLVAYCALSYILLEWFLKKKGVFDVDKRIKEIRCHLAVITLGAIQTIPQSFGQITCNFCFYEDRWAIGGRTAYGINHGQRTNNWYFGKKDVIPATVVQTAGLLYRLPAYFSPAGIIMGIIASASSGTASGSWPFLGSGVSGSATARSVSPMTNRHYMTDYLNSKEVMEAINGVLRC